MRGNIFKETITRPVAFRDRTLDNYKSAFR